MNVQLRSRILEPHAPGSLKSRHPASLLAALFGSSLALLTLGCAVEDGSSPTVEDPADPSATAAEGGKIDAGAAPSLPDGGPGLSPGDGVVEGGRVTFPSSTLVSRLPASGCPVPTGETATGREGLELLNRLRKHLGFGCASTRPALGAAAQSHAMYNARHVGDDNCLRDPHTEQPQCKGFVGAKAADRVREHHGIGPTESVVGESTAETRFVDHPIHFAISSLFEVAPYHRRAFVDSRTDLIGFAHASSWTVPPAKDASSVIVWAQTAESAAQPRVVVRWPMPGASDVPRKMQGDEESPTPPRPPSGWPSGYPISIHRPGVTWTATRLCKIAGPLILTPPPAPDAPCTAEIPHVSLLASNDPNRRLQPHDAFVYAHQPLDRASLYRVEFYGEQVVPSRFPWLENTREVITDSWTFGTGL
jgi:hypothetical protein